MVQSSFRKDRPSVVLDTKAEAVLQAGHFPAIGSTRSTERLLILNVAYAFEAVSTLPVFREGHAFSLRRVDGGIGTTCISAPDEVFHVVQFSAASAQRSSRRETVIRMINGDRVLAPSSCSLRPALLLSLDRQPVFGSLRPPSHILSSPSNQRKAHSSLLHLTLVEEVILSD